MVTTDISAGESWRYEITARDATAVTVHLVGPSKQTLTLEPEGDSDCWRGVADTGSWPPGEYHWETWVTYDDETKSVIERDYLTVRPSLLTATTGSDLRSPAEKALAAIDQWMATKDPTVRSYQINNRRLDRYSPAELISLRAHFVRIVRKERAKARGRRVVISPRIVPRF